MSCYQMNLLNEAEAALCPANEPSAEVLEAVFLGNLDVINALDCKLYWRVIELSNIYLLRYWPKEITQPLGIMYLSLGIVTFRFCSWYLVHMFSYFFMQVPNGAAGHYLLGLIYRSVFLWIKLIGDILLLPKTFDPWYQLMIFRLICCFSYYCWLIFVSGTSSDCQKYPMLRCSFRISWFFCVIPICVFDYIYVLFS